MPLTASGFRLAAMCFFGVLACEPDAPATKGSGPARPPKKAEEKPPINAYAGAPGFCSREGADAVRSVFCVEEPPDIRSLADLENALGLVFPPAEYYENAAPSGVIGLADETVSVILSHSTALGGDRVSPINPRVILIGGGSVAAGSILAFNRGAQQVEIVSNALDWAATNFYLVTFEQACNDEADGCRSGDLYTPRIESDWQAVTVQDAEDLKNTPSDCRQCHQRGTREPLLLMREVDGPWTHFFGPDVDDHTGFPEATGGDLVRDYLSAKGDEPYGGVPVRVIRGTIGFTLEEVVTFSQPVVFDGARIENERWPHSSSGYPSEPQRSATWYDAYESFKRGEQLPLPFHAPRATDPGKQAKLTSAYQRFTRGELGADELPDLGDIFPDDPMIRAEIGFQTEPGATAPEALVQACGTCHNDALDQTLSRARFNIAVGRLDRAELDAAIERIDAPEGAPGRMPPSGRRQLDVESRARLLDYLTQDQRSREDDAFLEHAARVGMLPARISMTPR